MNKLGVLQHYNLLVKGKVDRLTILASPSLLPSTLPHRAGQLTIKVIYSFLPALSSSPAISLQFSHTLLFLHLLAPWRRLRTCLPAPCLPRTLKHRKHRDRPEQRWSREDRLSRKQAKRTSKNKYSSFTSHLQRSAIPSLVLGTARTNSIPNDFSSLPPIGFPRSPF